MNLDIKKFHEYLNSDNLSQEQINWLELMYIEYPEEVSAYFGREYEAQKNKIESSKHKKQINEYKTGHGIQQDEYGDMGEELFEEHKRQKMLDSLLDYADRQVTAAQDDLEQQPEDKTQVDTNLTGLGADAESEAEQDQTPVIVLTQPAGQSRQRSVLRAAAILLLLLAGSYFLKIYFEKTGQGAGGKSVSDNTVTVMNRFYNFRGIPTTLTMPDGSLVQLMPESGIAWKGIFGQGNKDLFLTGEGIFTVNRDKQTDFRVLTKEIEIRDLGTVFYVNNKKQELRVKLLKGKVRLHSRHQYLKMADITLRPGDRFDLQRQALKFTLNGQVPGIINTEKAVSKETVHRKTSEEKTELPLNFKNEQLQTVLNGLALKYDKQITFNEEGLSGKSFTGDVSNMKGFEQTIKIICFTNGLRYQIKGDSVRVFQ